MLAHAHSSVTSRGPGIRALDGRWHADSQHAAKIPILLKLEKFA
jgi:hypothetical protein